MKKRIHKTYRVETEDQMGWRTYPLVNQVNRSFAEGFAFLWTSGYPSDPVRIVCNQDDKILYSHPGNSGVQLN